MLNLTPHAIVLALASGERVTIPPSGTVARVATTPGPFVGEALASPGHYATCDGYCPDGDHVHPGVPIYAPPVMGEIEGLPSPIPDFVPAPNPAPVAGGMTPIASFQPVIDDRLIIVSGMVAEAARQLAARLGDELEEHPYAPVLRRLVSPGTGPDDGAIRDSGGRIEAVTRLIRALPPAPARGPVEYHDRPAVPHPRYRVVRTADTAVDPACLCAADEPVVWEGSDPSEYHGLIGATDEGCHHTVTWMERRVGGVWVPLSASSGRLSAALDALDASLRAADARLDATLYELTGTRPAVTA